MAKKKSFVFPLLTLLLCLGVTPIMQAETGGSIAPEIHAVVPDYDENLLIIFGTDLFKDMTPPTVTLAGDAYEASVTQDGEVLVEVNLNLISPGDYLLVLQPDHRASKKVEFMLTLGAAGPAVPSGTLPSSYSVDTDFFYVDDAVQRAVVSVFCHSGDFAVGGAWAAGPDETTRYLGGGSGRSGYGATFENTESEFGVRLIVSCLDFSAPLHGEVTDIAICNYDSSDPGDYVCVPDNH